MTPITIVGGGLAGLTLGIALRRAGVPAEIIEAGTYPRHRVCGEFINGKGLETLERLGLTHKLIAAGARPIETVAFFSAKRCSVRRRLPEAGISLARWSLDATLAHQFEALGGKLHCGTRFTNDFSAPGIVRATGRKRQPNESGRRWFGMKAHACGLDLNADLEMHFLPDCYIGLCRLANGMVNVCGLFRGDASAGSSKERLRGRPGLMLYERLAGVKWEQDSFCAVGALPLHCSLNQKEPGVAIGDALTMVPPFTGNGMSFAFESAEIAAPHLAAFAQGEITWEQAARELRSSDKLRFGRRVWCANYLHHMLLRANNLVLWATRSTRMWDLCFTATR